MSDPKSHLPQINRPIPRAEALAAYQSGTSVAELCRRYRVSGERMRRMLQRRRIPIRDARQANKVRGRLYAMPAEQQGAIVEAYRQGTSSLSLRRQHHVAERVIRRILVAHGVPIRDIKKAVEARDRRNKKRALLPTDRVKGVLVQEMMDQYESGLSTGEISTARQIPTWLVRRTFSRVGQPMRSESHRNRLKMSKVPAEQRRASALYAASFRKRKAVVQASAGPLQTEISACDNLPRSGDGANPPDASRCPAGSAYGFGHDHRPV